MRYGKALTFCAAFVVSVVAASGVGSPASGKGGPILVNAPPDDVISRHISYADLNLVSAAGEQKLQGRVRHAVNGLCFEAAGGFDEPLMFSTAEARCTQASWEAAQPQIRSAVMRAREIAATGKSSIVAAALTITASVHK
jgi:UrcA family protein